MAKDTSKLRRKAAEQLKKGSRDKALALLKEACEKDQYDPENWLQLAELQISAGDGAAAADSMFRTTDIYARCGMVKEAFSACCRTLDLAPTHGPARRMGRFLISRLPEPEQDAADALLDQAGRAKSAAPPAAPAAPAAREAEPAPAAPAPAPAPPAPAAVAVAAPAEAAAAEAAPAEAAPAEAAAAVPMPAAVPAAAADEEDESAQEQTVDRGGRFRPAARARSAEAEPGSEPGEDEKTIERGAIRRAAEAEEEPEEKTIERGVVPRPAEAAGAGEPAEAGREPTPEGLPEEVAESAATSPWWTGTGQPPPLAPAEGTPEAADDDVTLPVWPPRAVLPPPPVEILTLEIEAELPEDGRPQPPVRGEIESPPAAPAAAAPGAGGPAPAAEAAAAARPAPAADGVPELIPLTFSGPAELPPDMPLPAEPPLDVMSLRDVLGVADGSADGPVEILVDPPVVEGAPEVPASAAAMRSPLLGDLDPALLKRLVDGAELQRRRRGEVVMRQGTFGTALYVILRGEVAVVRETPPPPVTLAKLRTGAFFGEMSLITNFPRSATVVAESDLDLLVVPRRQVSELCLADSQVLRTLLRFCRGRMVATMMAVSPIFQPLGPDVRKRLLQHFRLREYIPGAEVVTEGVESGGLHIVMAGRLKVARRGDEAEPKVLAALGPGDVFGEMSLLTKGPAMASITAESRVWVLVLPTLEFENAISREHPELVAYLGAVADERRSQNLQAAGSARAYRDGRIETP
jgi:CRP-like cAMP-binding protein